MKSNNNKVLKFINLDSGFIIACLALFCVFLIQTIQMKNVSEFLLPRALCLAGIILIVLMIITGHFKANDRGSEKVEQKEGIQAEVAISFAGSYFLITYFVGFILSTFMAVVAFSFIMKYANKKIVLVLSVLIPLALHLTFVTFLKANMPRGIVEKLLF